MSVDPQIPPSVAHAVQAWALSGFTAPLTICRTDGGFVVATSTKRRYTCGEFAALLGMSPNTWRKRVKEHLGLTPASDGQYDAETVEWARSQLKQEESRATPHELRMRRSA